MTTETASDFTITLLGKTFDEDEVRNAFELAVQTVRGVLDQAGLAGELVLAGITYPAADVPDAEDEDDDTVPDATTETAVEEDDGEA